MSNIFCFVSYYVSLHDAGSVRPHPPPSAQWFGSKSAKKVRFFLLYIFYTSGSSPCLELSSSISRLLKFFIQLVTLICVLHTLYEDSIQDGL